MTREIVRKPVGKLTAAWLAKVQVPEGCARVTVKDTEVPGLECRLSATGARAWAVSKRVRGVQRRFTVEGGERLGLAEARTAAIRLLDALADGRDPTEERRAARRAAALARLGIGRSWTIPELVDEYGARVAVPAGQRSWQERRGHVLRQFRELAALPVEEITDAHLWRILDAAVARGGKVHGWHGLRYLRTILGWAVSRKMIGRDPTSDLPLKDIRKRMRERARARVLSADELGRLWRVLEAEPANNFSAIFRLAALTGQRLGEVAGLRWADLDLARAEWRQPTNKSDRAHVVPLSAEARAVLEAIPRRPGVPRVFVTATGGVLARRTANFSRAAARYGRMAGVTDWGAHDLRRTAATLLAEARVLPVVIEQLLNHAEGAGKGGTVAAIYNRHSYAPEKREAVELVASHVRRLADRAGPT